MKLIWYLLCYSLLGFVGEVLYARLTHSAKPDRKCRLFLPLCPVYGIGAVVIALLPFRKLYFGAVFPPGKFPSTEWIRRRKKSQSASMPLGERIRLAI